MYKALKSAQNEIHEALLKFADEASGCKLNTSCQCVKSSPVPQVDHVTENTYDIMRIENIENTLNFLNQKQNAQFETLVSELQSLNRCLTNVLRVVIEQSSKNTVDTESTIPNLQPRANDSDLKNVCVETNHDGTLEQSPPSLETPQSVDTAQDLHIHIYEEEVQSDIEQDDTSPDIEEEEGIEVEEWTYKNKLFFKDSENTVYANTNGELGDPIGIYDPVKNIVKKLPAN
jgi:hypothetical protein